MRQAPALTARLRGYGFLAAGAIVACCRWSPRWQDYGRKGLNIALNRAPTKKFSGYVAYLSGELGTAVSEICASRYPRPVAAVGDRFDRRVLDGYLMRLGGRLIDRVDIRHALRGGTALVVPLRAG